MSHLHEIIFVFGLVAITWTYLLYPFWMKRKSRGRRHFAPLAEPADVAVILAAYNEEAVLEEKIRSTLESTYPADKISVYIGSDASTDATDRIGHEWAARDSRVHFFRFDQRTGKPAIVNELVKQCQAEWLILTDADTFFKPDTIDQLCRPFAEESIGGVQARFVSVADLSSNVARAELSYNDREIDIKRGQSADGAVIGAYGACYAIRRSLYEPVPPGFLVDDFFIFMKVLEKGYQTVLAEDALCVLEISGQSQVEFRRKARIGAGNYTNLFALRTFWWPFRDRVTLYYWSYKVLRWLTPFFLLQLLFSNLILAWDSVLWGRIFLFQVSVYLLSGLDLLLQMAGFATGPLRFASHFLKMNVALLLGFLRFMKGRQEGTWR